ncbi:hypothetical protein LVJ82_03400 [Vitreoscilla massiliensis]|uniref:Uncharacterized protein n=2 Tax=Vitreoscilla massiliensis TaxID=1689272 RepID=A0ABY4E6P5_9NEIS|nr:hypothetical protein [Vitreoscilla massiliensis]UOO90048.1 hypothetical protein LVJ82_03400 [Vitreoscilla massiliensis]
MRPVNLLSGFTGRLSINYSYNISYIWIEKTTHLFEFDTVIVRAKSDLPDDVPFTQIDISQTGLFTNAE